MEQKSMRELQKEKKDNLLYVMNENTYIFNNLNDYIKTSLKEEIKEKTTIKDVASSIGIDYQRLIRVLSGESNLPLDIIFRIALYLDIDLSDFFNVVQEALNRTLETLAEEENKNINYAIKRIKKKL